jgi:hypothetical protein
MSVALARGVQARKSSGRGPTAQRSPVYLGVFGSIAGRAERLCSSFFYHSDFVLHLVDRTDPLYFLFGL